MVRRPAAALILSSVLVPAQSVSIYRFDDQLKSAAVSVTDMRQAGAMAAPFAWKSFTPDTTWQSVRGGMGIRRGELIVQGEGGSPVIQAPKDLSVDWSRYKSVRIRMMAEGGTEARFELATTS